MTIKNTSIQQALTAYLAKPAEKAPAALAADAADWVEAAQTAGVRYSGHRVTIKGAQILFEGRPVTRAQLETALAASGGADDLSAISAEISALMGA